MSSYTQPGQDDIAMLLAYRYHEGQTRKDGVTPYIAHPRAVAAQLLTPTLKAAGFLHDVIEDCGVTAAELLAEGIKPEVIELVLAVTRREGETYRQFIARTATCGREAIAIKLADLRANMADLAGLERGERIGLMQRCHSRQQGVNRRCT